MVVGTEVAAGTEGVERRNLEQSGKGCGRAVNFQFVRVERGQLPVLFVLFPLMSKLGVTRFMRDVDLMNDIKGDELILVKTFMECWGHRGKPQ